MGHYIYLILFHNELLAYFELTQLKSIWIVLWIQHLVSCLLKNYYCIYKYLAYNKLNTTVPLYLFQELQYVIKNKKKERKYATYLHLCFFINTQLQTIIYFEFNYFILSKCSTKYSGINLHKTSTYISKIMYKIKHFR